RLIRSCAIEAAVRKAAVRVRASSSWETSIPEKAFDGRSDTDWNAGDYAPSWIEAELPAAELASIVLVPAQDIPGPTTHEIWVSDEPMGNDRTKARLVHTFDRPTQDHDRLQFDCPKGLSARYLQVRTTKSPTWIAWWEVDVRFDSAGRG